MFNQVMMVLAFITLFLNLFLGLLALTQSRKNSIYRSFFLMNAIQVVWHVSYYITIRTHYIEMADIIILECSSVLIPAILLHFVLRITKNEHPVKFLVLGYGLAFAWCVVFIVSSITIWRTVAALTGLTVLFLGIISMTLLIRAIMRVQHGVERRCLVVIAIGFLIYLILGAGDYLLCYLYDFYLFIGVIGSLIFSICIAWAVFTYQLLDLKESVRQAIWSLIVFAILYFLYLGVHRLVISVKGMGPLALVISVLVVAYVLSPLGPRRIREGFHSIFFPDKITLVDIINLFVTDVAGISDVNNLTSRYLSSVTEGLSSHSGALYFYNKDGVPALAGYSGDGPPLSVSKGIMNGIKKKLDRFHGFHKLYIDIGHGNKEEKVYALSLHRGEVRTVLLFKESQSRGHLTTLEQRFLEILTAEFTTTLLRLREEDQNKPAKSSETTRFGPFVGGSQPMRDLYDSIRKVSSSDATVLITGESGTGKELVASTIHQLSSRRNGPLVAVNCSTLTGDLLGSELFGHERGAFTGAVARRVGKFEQASGGTLFLDEIGEIPPATQSMLLRVLEDKRIVRLGGTQSIKVDVRIIAATNSDLAKEVKDGHFREDLFYRLNVIPIQMPPLRERTDDIPLLVDYYIEEVSRRFSKTITGINQKALTQLANHSWPGNVRELANTIERAVLVAESTMITSDDLGFEMGVTHQVLSLKDVEDGAERDALVAALKKTNGNVTHAAKLLGVSRVTLQKKMKKYQLRDLFR